MKQLSIVALALILLTSCETTRKKTAQQPAPPPPPNLQMPKEVQVDPAKAALRESAALMRELTLRTDTALPDGLLNRTRCFILGLKEQARGLSTCRSADNPYAWTAPEQVTLHGPIRLGENTLIFLLSDRAANALQRGDLDLATLSVAAGKTRSQAVLLTPQDVGYDLVTYRYDRHNLTGTFVSITEIKSFGVSSRAEVPGGPTGDAEYTKWVESYFNTITPTGIIIHHSAVLPATHKIPGRLEEVDDYHAERGFAIECQGREYHVAYHYLIFPNGRIQAGRPERCEGAHARGYNSFIGISMVGDFSAKDRRVRGTPARPTTKQIRSLLRLTRQLQHEYNIPVQRILRHSDVAPTLCPGELFAFKSFLLALEQPEAVGR